MPPIKVIVSLDSNHKLKVNHEVIDVNQGDSIVWEKIPYQVNEIKWIRIIPQRSPFNPPIPNGDWHKHPVQILERMPVDTYYYSIAYDTQHWGGGTLDPKIAVHPATTYSVFFIVITLLISSFSIMRSFGRVQNFTTTGEK